jgi:hypothetical protein
MKIATRKSNKLFYKKYLYKIEIHHPLSSIFRKCLQRTDELDYAWSTLREYNSKLKGKKYIEIGNRYTKQRITQIDVDDAGDIRNHLLTIDDYMIRQEGRTYLFLYLNDVSILLPALKKLTTIEKITVWEPDPAILNNNDADVLVSKQAENYAFKITMNMDGMRDKSSNILKWIESNRDKIKITDYSLNHGWSFSTIYVRDEKVLLMLQMTGNNFISRTHRLVLPG